MKLSYLCMTGYDGPQPSIDVWPVPPRLCDRTVAHQSMNRYLDMAELVESATTAVFYTIWSYAAGAGRVLIQEAQKSIETEFPGIQTYVTLSPKTEMARRFHLKNGARELRENPNTINYIYK